MFATLTRAALRKCLMGLLAVSLLHGGRPVFGEDDIPQFAPPPTITPMQIPQMMDRQKSSAMAVAMAAQAMAMSMIMCMEMMRQAQEEKDKDKKAMLMMMAQQACQQAQEAAKNMKENDDGKKKLSQNDGPKMAQLGQVAPFQAPKTKKEENLLKNLPTATTDEESLNVGELPVPGQVTVPEVTIPGENKISEGETEPPLRSPDLDVSSPPAIDKQVIGYKEDSKGGGTTPVPSALGGGVTTAAAKGVSSDDMKKAEGVTSTELRKDNRNWTEDKDNHSATSGGETSEAGSKGTGGTDFEGLLNSLLGGGPGPEGAPGIAGTSGDILLFSKRKNPSEKGPNIFEYATYRFKNAAYKEGRIRGRQLIKGASLKKKAVPIQTIKAAFARK